MCPYAKQDDKRQMIQCTKTAGICGHMMQAEGFWVPSRGAETCGLRKVKRPEKIETMRTADDVKAETRRKARTKK